MGRKIAGVDDAGRGSIIGPLIIAGVCIDEDEVYKLVDAGVKDSKLLSPAARERLAPIISGLAASVYVEKVSADEVDKFVFTRKKYRRLNYLEAITMARVLERLNPESAIVDASDTSTQRFRDAILESLGRPLEIISAHHADYTFPVVSAASIIAKVERDREVELLRARYGDFGSGYPADPRTVSFLKEWLRREGGFPPFARKSWKTWKALASTELL